MKLYEPSQIREIKRRFGFRFSKSLGQNFLIDKPVIDGIVEGAGINEEDLVIEIGPGIGVLTDALSEKAGKVVAIEIDKGLLEILKYTLPGKENVTIVNGNVLKMDLGALIEQEKEGCSHVKIAGNLPYYITTPIIMKLLEDTKGFESVTVMMQKEVAERIISGPGSKAYGAISLAVQYYADVTWIEDVEKSSFMPEPKVDSAVIRMDILDSPRVSPLDEKIFFEVIRSAFSKRRKTLLNSLSGVAGDKDELRAILEKAGIDEKRRAEELSLEDYKEIADGVFEKRNTHV